MKHFKEDSQGKLRSLVVQPERPLSPEPSHGLPTAAPASSEYLVAAQPSLVVLNTSEAAENSCFYPFSDALAPPSPSPLSSTKAPGTFSPANEQTTGSCRQQHCFRDRGPVRPTARGVAAAIHSTRMETSAHSAVTEAATASRRPEAVEAAQERCSLHKCSADTSQGSWGRPSTSGSDFALPRHLLAFVLSLVGNQSAEKAAISRVCRYWREVVNLHYTWRSVDASHRPISSLSTSAETSAKLNSLWRMTETLVLAEKDAATATELLLQLSHASCSNSSGSGSSCISSSSKIDSSISHMCDTNSSCSDSGNRSSSSSKREVEEATAAQTWTLPHLKHLRIHRSMGGGYTTYSTPQDVLAAADAARGSSGTTSLHSGSRKGPNSSSSSSSSSSGLQQLEELVLETEVGPDLLLALRGKTPRLKTLIISRLSDKPSSSHQGISESAASAATEAAVAKEESVSALEALLLFLEELPPQQLVVFGFGMPLGSSGGRNGNTSSSNSSSSNSSSSDCKLPEGLRGLRARLQRRGGGGNKEEAAGDELCCLLASKHHESLRALWMPDICTSLEGAGDLLLRCCHLTVCSIPGASVLHELHFLLGSGRSVDCSSTPLVA
ncbi:uncharacterized protein EMH_0003330 [Eimeria mitis]|uniref:Uncharacterized protein n=1 Tax=Eimeria mitis TaxID=44415 RepID=U6K0D2_9EIME|nr:uncharacterized protein EMH_0003330 [Eimeria mitis]CDJ29223.1 hypothetical protein, conserved [Eimeria mitis]